MAYQANIPKASDKRKDSQSDILGNFQAIKTVIDINHETFGSADEGKHKFIGFPVQGAAPATAAGEMALYSTTSALSGNPELSVREESSGTSVEFTSKTAASDGWTRLPSGILLKWGQTSVLVAGANTTTLPVAATVPAFTTIYNIQVSAQSDGAADPNSAMYSYAVDALSFGVWLSIRDTAAGTLATPLVAYYFITGI